MSSPSRTALVHGLALSGMAVVRQLQRRGWTVVTSDDRDDDVVRGRAAELGCRFVGAPSDERLVELVAASEIVCPAPGVPEDHAVCRAALAAGVALRTEIDLAYEWEQTRQGGPRPMLGVTGTDGKTTTTMMAAHILRECGVRSAAVGNTEVPLLDALDSDVDAFVVECSSFRLHWIDHFRCAASVWLNLAPDHQNWHVSMESYESAKARMWAHMRDGDVAIGHVADPVVMRRLAEVASRGLATRTFGADDGADYRQDGEWLVGPAGRLAPVSALARGLPHDVTNTLAALAVCLESGLVAADVDALSHALSTFRHPPHRIEPVGEIDGVRWFNDSKATSPHAALTAIRSFERVVLLAGGRNKGLDLTSLAGEAARIVTVVGLGEAGPEVVAAFEGRCPTALASSMDEAVELARRSARPGDVVLLSPACASFDWYPTGGYPARGEHFTRLVRALPTERRPDTNGANA